MRHWALVLAIVGCVQMRVAAQPIAPEVAALYNMVQNGGFEEGGEQPAWWSRYPATDADGNRILRDTARRTSDATTAHTGKASGLVWSVTPYTPGKPWMQWNKYDLPVEGGQTLIAFMYTKTDGIPQGGAGCHFYGEERKHLGFVKTDIPKDAREWTYIRSEIPVPDGTRSMGLALYAAEKGKTWYDDVALIGVPAAKVARATPAVDGKLDEACWGEQHAIATFVEHTGARVIKEPIRAWAAYDDDNLYVAFACPHPRGAKLREEAKQHDGNVWLDDSVEVFLNPQRKRPDYYQICVNALGVVRDSHEHDTAWESGARVGVTREDEAWKVEAAIAFDRLDLGLDTGKTWGLNLVWNDRVRGQTATWSLGGFHKPGRFGIVELAPDLARFFRADVAGRVQDCERHKLSVQKEIDDSGLSDEGKKESLRLLAETEQTLEDLRKVARGEKSVSEESWDEVRRRLASVSEGLAAAKTAALNEHFRAGPTGSGGDFRAVIAGSLQKIRREGPLTGYEIIRKISLDAAQDEAESFQIVVLPNGKALRGVTVEAKPLVGENAGQSAPVTWQRVEYVETGPGPYPAEYVGWWPDPLFPAAPFDVAADQRQPLWFTVNVPPDAKPGAYKGQITIRHGATTVAVPVDLRVRNFRIPRPGTLAAPFGLYLPHLAKWWFGKEHLKMPVEKFVQWCRFMGEYRLSPKNISREYVTQTQDAGGLRVDLSILHRTVVPLAAKYYPPYSYNLFRTPTGPQIGKIPTATDPDKAAEAVKAWVQEWKRQGLPDKVYIYGYDEPLPGHYPFLREAYKRIREVAPEYPIMQTIGDPSPRELVGLVDIWCPLSSRADSPFYADRRKAGETLWTYVCCGPRPPHANFFVDQPAVDHRVLFWQVRQLGATGLLYWCICFWDGLPSAASGGPCFPDAPIRLKDHCTFRDYKVNGDGILVYPGRDMTPWPSLRLEVIRDGIEDYECLAMLSRLVEKAKAQGVEAALVQQAEALCAVPESISKTMTDYVKDPRVLLEQRGRINDMIERLGARVEGPQSR